MTHPPTIVIAGEFATWSTELGLTQGFRRLGWGVQDVKAERFAVAGRHPALRLLRRLVLDPMARRAYHERILQAVQELRPDFFFTVKGNDIPAELLHRIRSCGATTVVFYPDLHFSHRALAEEWIRSYDVFITSKSFQVSYARENFRGVEVAFVHHGYVDDVHRPCLGIVQEQEYRHDVVYCGNHDAHKQRWLESLVKELPEIDLEILGARWSGQTRGTALERCVTDSVPTGFAYARAIQSARINLAIHGGRAGPHGWQDLVSTRSFEIPACRGFMLHVDNPEVRSLFEVGSEIDVFATPRELADKIRFYLGKPELRAQMIERAYARCVPAYGYEARAREIGEILIRRAGSRQGC